MHQEPLNPIPKDPVSLQPYIDMCKRLLRQPSFARGWQEQKRVYQQRLRQMGERRRSDEGLHTVPADENQFMQPKPVGDQQPESTLSKSLHLGIEFDDVILEENDLLQFIIRNRYYLLEVYLTEDQMTEFDEIFNNIDQVDCRNVGTVVGMAMLGVIGCTALGFSVIGIVAFGVMGVIMGRYAGKRIKRSLKRKQNRLNELDVFEIRVRCLIKWVRVNAIKYKYNINLLRFIVERIILEIKPALHYHYFDKAQRNQVKYLMGKVVTLFKEPEVYTSLLLSFKLCQEYWNQLILINNPENYCHNLSQKMDLENSLLRSVDNVLRPFNTLIQFANMKKSNLLDLQREIQRFLIHPSIIHLALLFPDPQMSLEFVKLFTNKMKAPVKLEHLEASVRNQNWKDIEHMGVIIGIEGKKQQKQQPPQHPNESFMNQNQLEKVEERVEEGESSDEEEKKPSFDEMPAQELVLEVKQPESSNHTSKEIQINAMPPSNYGSEKIKLSITEHPNRVNMQYLLSRIGDNEELAASPMKKRVQIQSQGLILQQPIQMEEVKLQPEVEERQYDAFTQDRWNYFVSILKEPYSTWERVVDKDQILIYKTLKPGNSSVFVKGEALIPNVPKEVVLQCVCDPEYRTLWDKILSGFSIIDTNGSDEQVIFFYTAPPIPIVAIREFVQKRIRRENFPEPGQTALLFFTVDCANQPIKKGRVRVQTDIAGYVFETVQGGTQMYFISNNDVKGNVPRALVNYASAKAPFQWFGNLRKISLQVFQADGDLNKLKKK